MTKPHNDELIFGVFIMQVEDTVEHSNAGGEPFTNHKIVSKSCNFLIKSGIFALGCRE